MAKCSKNLRSKRRRRLKAESALLRRLASLEIMAEDFLFKYMESSVRWAEDRDKLAACQKEAASLRSQSASLAASVEMLLKGRLLTKVVEGFSPESTMVRVRYRHPDVHVRVPVAVPPEEAFAVLGERIARKAFADPLAAKTFLSHGFAEEFYREFMDDVYGEVVLCSLRHLGDQLASAIFAGVCLNSIKLALKLKEESRV